MPIRMTRMYWAINRTLPGMSMPSSTNWYKIRLVRRSFIRVTAKAQAAASSTPAAAEAKDR
ncbi:hypothetical protein D3C72_2412420 [compost metagenome]